jgi:exopolysaccharide biosynthesis polyprenyl glycosylphosphotransferase
MSVHEPRLDEREGAVRRGRSRLSFLPTLRTASGPAADLAGQRIALEAEDRVPQPRPEPDLPPLSGPPLLLEPAVPRSGFELQGAPRWQRQLVRTIMATDFAMATLAALVAAVVSFGDAPAVGYLGATMAFPLVWVLANALTRSYEPRFLGTGSEEYRRVFDAGVRLLAGAALLSLGARLELARMYVLVAFPCAVVLCLVARYLLRQRLHRQRTKGRCQHSVVVVGRERSCAELVRQLRREPYAGFNVVGACVDHAQGLEIEDVPVVGTSRSIVDALRRTGADTVAVGAWSDLTQADLRRLSWELEGSGVALVVAPSLTDVAGPRIHIRPVSGLPLLHIEEPEFNGGRRVLKGLVDRSAAALALLVLGPTLLALALAVRLDSRGPALFRQTRTGVDGRPFTMFKLRSMYLDAEQRLSELAQSNESDGLLFKMRDDPRVTRAGKWLRRFSLDELPQLLNVVKGDMSLVGPRPPLPVEVSRYERDVRRRLLVKPGLTGLWQISGRSDLSWEESVRLDLYYVESWSLALDLMIMWKTFFAVVQRRGAY